MKPDKTGEMNHEPTETGKKNCDTFSKKKQLHYNELHKNKRINLFPNGCTCHLAFNPLHKLNFCNLFLSVNLFLTYFININTKKKKRNLQISARIF